MKSDTEWNIYNNNCFDIFDQIQDNIIDLILTDPPYIISKKSGFHAGTNSKYSNGAYKTEFGNWDKESVDLEELCKNLYRVLKPKGYCIIFFDVWKLGELKEAAKKMGFVQPRVIQYQKTNPVPVNSKINYLTNGIEYALTFTKKGTPNFNTKYHNGVFRYPICHGKERTKHPTQKPLKLISELINIHSKENDLVFDPFMGSGTTGEAAIRAKRNFIGIEKEKEYFDISMNRLSNINTFFCKKC